MNRRLCESYRRAANFEETKYPLPPCWKSTHEPWFIQPAVLPVYWLRHRGFLFIQNPPMNISNISQHKLGSNLLHNPVM